MFNQSLPSVIRQSARAGWYKVQQYVKKMWVRLAIVGVLGFALSQNEVTVQLSFGRPASGQSEEWVSAGVISAVDQHEEKTNDQPKAITVAHKTQKGSPETWWEAIRNEPIDVRTQLNLANPATAVSNALTEEQQVEAAKFSNLGFILNPDLAKRKKVDPAVVAAKNQVCYDYLDRYAKTAQEEAKLFNVPASITLAQALLESNAGESNLAAKENNHFGIKCQDKCVGCRCANYTDDSQFDMFRIFNTPWESFRAHSKLLTGKRYKHLLKLPRTDYRNWAYGLKAAGYATDKQYAEKLINIIEALKLYKYDK